MFDGAEEGGRGECGIHHEREMVFLRDGGISLDVRDVKRGIADRLNEEEARFFCNRRLDGREIVDRREIHLDARVRQDGVELREGAAVEVARRDDLVAGAGDVRNGEEDRRRPGGEGPRRRAALQRREALLQHVVRRVHEPGVDVAEFLESEQIRAMLRIVEVVGGGPVDGDRPRMGRRIAVRILPGVNGQCFKMVFAHG